MLDKLKRLYHIPSTEKDYIFSPIKITRLSPIISLNNNNNNKHLYSAQTKTVLGALQ